MLVCRTSPVTGIYHRRHIDLDVNDYFCGMKLFATGRLSIQDAFPWLSPEDRAYIASGIAPGESRELTHEAPRVSLLQYAADRDYAPASP